MGGGTVDFRELRGKVVLVDMWYNFCSVCIASMPSLQKLYKRYQPQGFEIVGLWTEAKMHPGMVNYATGDKQVEDARAILKKQGATWPNAVVKQEEFWPAYAISGMPTLWLLDQKGRLVTAQAEGTELEPEIRRLLGLPPMGPAAPEVD
jgi:thiol-disulfide isomerase/thioredoxin